MRSGTSFFDWTVFKKTVCRFWPLWSVYLAIWLVTLPLNGFMMMRMDSYAFNDFSYMEEFAYGRVPQTASGGTMVVLTIAFGVAAAMAVFSHLYNARSANLFGSLPIRREGLFVTHYLAGLAFLMVPNLVIFLLTLLVELAGGAVCWQGLWFWMAVACGEGFFFYSMAVFCGLFTGHILALPAFYAVFNCIVIGVTELLSIVLQAFYYGFAGFTDGVYEVAKWCTPTVRLSETVKCFTNWIPDNGLDSVLSDGQRVLELHGLGTVGVYAIVGVVLAVCAFFLYRVRRLESAGDVVSVKAMRPVFKYGVALCAGLALGMVTVFFTGGGEVTLMIGIVVWGVIGYFAAEMLLQKSFKVFKRWKGAAVIAAVFVALFLVVGLDLTGFETRIPDPAQVDSVYVYSGSVSYLGDDGDELRMDITDSEIISQLVILHREAVEQRDEERQTQAQIGGVSTHMMLTYTLKGGGTMTRQYTIWLSPKEAGREGTAAWAMQRIYDNRELYWQVYGFDKLEEYLAQGGRLERVTQENYDDMTGLSDEASFYGQDAAALFTAMKEDFFAGRIGARRVDDGDNWRGYPDESLTFAADKDDNQGYFRIRIALDDTATSTLAALEEMADRAVKSETEGYRW